MTPDPDVDIPHSDALDRAGKLVVDAYPIELLLTPDEAMVEREVAAMLAAVRREIAGEDSRWTDRAPLDRLHLLRSLRHAVLEEWSEHEPLPLLHVMRAFEAVERALGGGEADASAADAVRPFARSLLREVAHALLSPLGSIVMLAETLREDSSGPLSEAQHRRLNIIHRAAASGASISNDLLTLTSPKMHYEGARRFPVAEVVEQIADLVRPVTEARGSELVVNQAVREVRRGPGSAITQALVGLALRAALMTRDGAIELSVEPMDGDRVAFVLGARGGHMAEDAPKDPFLVFRTESGAEGYTLAPEGLALSAAREVIRSLGSELEVRSGDGEMEMRFEVELPLAESV